MIRKPIISIGGKFADELNKIWDALISLQPGESPDIRTNQTTRGTTFELKQKRGADAYGPVPVTVISETRQWLKCQTSSQLDTGSYTWVAKPPGLRTELAPTDANYSAVTWGAAFTGERFIYRNPAERLRLYSPDSSGVNAMGLRAAFTLFERNEGGDIQTAADAYLDTIPPIAGGTDRLGSIHYLYEFQRVYPAYTHFTGMGSTPVAASGQPGTIYIARLHPDDLPDETPADATFASAVKWLDLNVSGRQWVNREAINPRELHIFSAGGSSTWGAIAALPQQYTDQTHGNSNPTIKTLLPSFWPELQP